jgi:hypothetical protein
MLVCRNLSSMGVIPCSLCFVMWYLWSIFLWILIQADFYQGLNLFGVCHHEDGSRPMMFMHQIFVLVFRNFGIYGIF